MAKKIEGWLIRYNEMSRPIELPSGRKVFEVIQSDAFAESVAQIIAGTATIEANIEHIDDAISRIGLSGKNVLIENLAEGVYATINLLDDSLSADVFAKAQAGIVTGLSVEFDPSPANAEPSYELVDGNYLRKWSRLTLRGFAICVSPMYPGAQIVKASETVDASAARSIGSTEVEKIRREIAAMEARTADAAEQVKRAQWDIYERQGFILGIRP
jgi:HK97 family phage prohead protease